MTGPEDLAWCEQLQRRPERISSRLPEVVAPPADDDATLLRQLQAEEDDHHRDDHTSVQAGRQQVVVAHPPAEVTATDEPLEDSADDEERGEVDAGRGRNDDKRADGEGRVDVAEDGAWVAAREQVEWNREYRADEEEPKDRVVPE